MTTARTGRLSDFLIVGAMKAGTTSLDEELASWLANDLSRWTV